jgi:hypothetical protein
VKKIEEANVASFFRDQMEITEKKTAQCAAFSIVLHLSSDKS